METVRKSNTFTKEQDSWIKLKVQSGDFTNDSEYIRDLVRKDQDRNQKLFDLKSALDEGLQSGKSTLKISDLIAKEDKEEL